MEPLDAATGSAPPLSDIEFHDLAPPHYEESSVDVESCQNESGRAEGQPSVDLEEQLPRQIRHVQQGPGYQEEISDSLNHIIALSKPEGGGCNSRMKIIFTALAFTATSVSLGATLTATGYRMRNEDASPDSYNQGLIQQTWEVAAGAIYASCATAGTAFVLEGIDRMTHAFKGATYNIFIPTALGTIWPIGCPIACCLLAEGRRQTRLLTKQREELEEEQQVR